MVSLQASCQDALYSTLQRWNGWQWCRTSHIHTSNHANIPNAHTPSCQLASVILRVCSIAHRGNWVASVALDLLCDRAYSFAQLSSSFLFTCNWTSPKSHWAALVTLTKKGRKVSKAWWGWRKLEHFTALMRRSLTDKRHTASFLGSRLMSHQVPNGNSLSPRQLDPISHSPQQYLYIVVLSSSFIW